MFRTIFGATQVNLGENIKENKQFLACFGLIEENMDLSHIH
jgi:hypothetical protein